MGKEGKRIRKTKARRTQKFFKEKGRGNGKVSHNKIKIIQKTQKDSNVGERVLKR